MSLGVALGFFFRWLRAIFEHLLHGMPPRERSANLAEAAEALHPEAPGE